MTLLSGMYDDMIKELPGVSGQVEMYICTFAVGNFRQLFCCAKGNRILYYKVQWRLFYYFKRVCNFLVKSAPLRSLAIITPSGLTSTV